MNNTNNVRNFYNQQIKSFPKSPAILSCPSQIAADYRVQKEWETFYSLVSMSQDNKCLEIGCGGGRWGIRISKYVDLYIGIDISDEAIAYAKRNSGSHNTRYIRTSLEDFETDETFDLIYFSGVLLYVTDDVQLEKLLNKYKSYLNHEGAIVIRDSIPEKTQILQQSSYCAKYRSIEDLVDILDKQMFTLVKRNKSYSDLFFGGFWNSFIVNILYEKTVLLYEQKKIVDIVYELDCIFQKVFFFREKTHKSDFSHDFLIFKNKLAEKLK